MACVPTPSVAVLLAARNGEAWINEQIDSILSQDSVNVSIFISVDLSDDSTLTLCEQRARHDPRIFVLTYGERFGSAARNFYRLVLEVDTSAYEFVAFSDQDDIWLEDKVFRAVEVLSVTGSQCYSSDVISFWEDGRTELVKKSYPQTLYDHFFEAAGPGCTYVLKRSAYKVVKSFLLKQFDICQKTELHDWLFYAICRESKLKWVIDDQPKILYRQHMNNQVGSNNNFRAYVRRVIILFSRGNWYQNQIRVALQLFNENHNFKLTSWFVINNFWRLRRRPRDQVAILLVALLGGFL